MDRDRKSSTPAVAVSNHQVNRTGAVRSISSDQLMGGRRFILIQHGKDEYRLQITGSGKLILTK